MSLIVDVRKKLGSFELESKFEAQNGVTCLLGPSGCGKSMTLKCIAGIEKPDEGYIELDGVVLYDSAKGINLPPQKRRVGYLFQNYALFPNMTVRQNILCGMRRIRDKSEKEEKLKKCWICSSLEDLKITVPRSSPAVRLSARRLRASWSVSRSFYCWTSPFPRSTRTSGISL